MRMAAQNRCANASIFRENQFSFQSLTLSVFVGFSQCERLGNWLVLELWICTLNELAERLSERDTLAPCLNKHELSGLIDL